MNQLRLLGDDKLQKGLWSHPCDNIIVLSWSRWINWEENLNVREKRMVISWLATKSFMTWVTTRCTWCHKLDPFMNKMMVFIHHLICPDRCQLASKMRWEQIATKTKKRRVGGSQIRMSPPFRYVQTWNFVVIILNGFKRP